MNKQTEPKPAPESWWRVGPMWLVVGGPVLVVLASFTTLGIAILYGDVPLAKVAVEPADSMAPATQARNHVAGAVR